MEQRWCAHHGPGLGPGLMGMTQAAQEIGKQNKASLIKTEEKNVSASKYTIKMLESGAGEMA